MPDPWRAAAERIQGDPIAVVFVSNMEVETVEKQLAELPSAGIDTIVGVGGGQACDLVSCAPTFHGFHHCRFRTDFVLL